MNKRQFLTTIGASALALGAATLGVPEVLAASDAGFQRLYIERNGAIYWVNHLTGNYRRLTSYFWYCGPMAGIKEKLYVLCDGLYELHTLTGEYRKVTTDIISGMNFIAFGEKLYSTYFGRVYVVNPTDGTYKQLEAHSPSVALVEWLVVNAQGKFYALCRAWRDDTTLLVLHSIDVERGTSSQLSEDDWSGIRSGCLTALDDKLYAVSNGRLYVIDGLTGKYSTLSDDNWWGTRELVALDGNLYALHGYGLYRINPRTAHTLWLRVCGTMPSL